MKVLTMQITNQENNNMGGAYERYMALINSFLDEGWEVHHISPKGFSNIKHESLIHHGILDFPLHPRFVLFYIQSFFEILWLHNNINIIVVSSALEAIMGVISKLFNKNTKLLVVFNGDPISDYEFLREGIKKYIFIKFMKFIDNIVVNNADLLIFISKKNREDILRRVHYNNKNSIVKVIYHGVTPRLKSLSEQNPIKYTKNTVIGFVGRLTEIKGLDYLIKAFYNIKSSLQDPLLVIVGDGPDKNKYIDLVKKLNLEDNVIFTGYKKNPLIYMKSFDLMVVPSLSEGFGMVIIEALNVGTPVLGSKIGGIPEVLKYEELLFDLNNKELELKILNVFKNKETYEEILELCNKRKNLFKSNWEEEVMDLIKNYMDYRL
jgi:glycosyltransferase involved in cell wall biosynthesis